MGDYSFTRVTRGDYDLLRRWLSGAHIAPWWGKPAEEIALIDEEIDTGPTDMRIVSHQGTPFAYVQDWPAAIAPQFQGLPPGTRAMDTFLGEPAFLGRGHAPRYLRARAEELRAAGAPHVVIDPDPANIRAVKSYRRAGFTGDETRQDEEGKDVLVLHFRPRPSHP